MLALSWFSLERKMNGDQAIIHTVTYHQWNAKSKILVIIISSTVMHVCADRDEC